MKGVISGRKKGGHELRDARGAPAAVGQGEASAEEEQSASAAVHELAQQLLLAGGEVVGLNRADDDGIVGKQVFRTHGKAVGELVGILDALAVELVFGGAQHGDNLELMVVLSRAAQEFVLPARLAFDVKDAALLAADGDEALERVVGCALFAGQRSCGEGELLDSGGAGAEENGFGLSDAVWPQRHLAFSERVRALPHAERGFAAAVSMLGKTECGAEA